MRKLACFAAPFGLASLLCACAGLSGYVPLLPGGLCALLTLPALRLRGRARLRALLILLGAALGFCWFALWTALFVSPADALDDKTVSCSAVALDYPWETDSGHALEVRLDNGVPTRLYVRGELSAAPGDRLDLTADFVRTNYLFGEENTSFSARGVFLFAYADEGSVTVFPAPRTPLLFLPRVWANRLTSVVDQLFSPPHAALLRAMLLGDKSNLADGVVSAFNRSGLAHVLVVSGLHLSVLLQSLIFLLRRRRRLLLSIAVPFLILFTPHKQRKGYRSKYLCNILNHFLHSAFHHGKTDFSLFLTECNSEHQNRFHSAAGHFIRIMLLLYLGQCFL